MAGHKQPRERTYLAANKQTQISRQQGESPVTQSTEQPLEQPLAWKPQGIAESARKLKDTPNPVARQQIFRKLATQYGNTYASKVTTVMRDSAKTAAAPDVLDTLLGLSEHRNQYNDQQLQQARQLAAAETDQAKRAKLFKLLQTKTTYYNQNQNQSKGFDTKTHQTWNLGIGMCNVTSLAMALEGMGITFSQAKAAFPNTYQKYRDTLLAEDDLSLEDRQKWVAATSEATRFPDFLEQLRVVNHFRWLTQSDTWSSLARLFGVELEFITSNAGQHPKQWWLDNAQTAFEAGQSVVVGVQNHIIRLQEINDLGLVLDDPNAQTDLSKGMTARDGTKLDLSWNYAQSGNDTLVPWEVAEKYNFRWVYKLKAPGTNPGRAAAKKAAPTAQASPAAPVTVAKPASGELLSQVEQQKALAAMRKAIAAGMSQNAVIDQGYFAIQGSGKIDPTDKQAVARWLFIKNNLLKSAQAGKPESQAKVAPTTPAQSEGWITDMYKKVAAEQARLAQQNQKSSQPAPTQSEGWIMDMYRKAQADAAKAAKTQPAVAQSDGWIMDIYKKAQANARQQVATPGPATTKPATAKKAGNSAKTAVSKVDPGAPAWRSGSLTTEMVNAIIAAREAVPEVKAGKGGLNRAPYAGDNNAGMMYLPSQSTEEKAFSKEKSGKQSDGTTKTAQSIIWEELASEGSSNSINTYDGQGMTWGRGFAAGGLLPDMIWRFFAEVPGSRAEFNSVGIDSDGTYIYTVDVGAKAVIQGNSELHDLRNNRKISSFFIHMGEKHPKALVEAQFETVTKHRAGAANVPEWALNLPKPYLQFIAHASHWYSGAFGWSRWRGHTADWPSMMRRYVKLLPGRHMYRTKATASGVVHEAQAIEYALGIHGNKSWQSLAEAALEPAVTAVDTETLGSGEYLKVGKNSYRRIKN